MRSSRIPGRGLVVFCHEGASVARRPVYALQGRARHALPPSNSCRISSRDRIEGVAFARSGRSALPVYIYAMIPCADRMWLAAREEREVVACSKGVRSLWLVGAQQTDT